MTLNAIHPADVRVVPDWELCDRLRRSMRLVSGMTNEDVAQLMGVRRETISTWLGGRRVPPKTTLMIWADMTGVDRQWLMTGEPSEQWYAMRDLNPQPADLEPWTYVCPFCRQVVSTRGHTCVGEEQDVARPVLRLIHGGRIERPPTVKPALTLICGAA